MLVMFETSSSQLGEFGALRLMLGHPAITRYFCRRHWWLGRSTGDEPLSLSPPARPWHKNLKLCYRHRWPRWCKAPRCTRNHHLSRAWAISHMLGPGARIAPQTQRAIVRVLQRTHRFQHRQRPRGICDGLNNTDALFYHPRDLEPHSAL